MRWRKPCKANRGQINRLNSRKTELEARKTELENRIARLEGELQAQQENLSKVKAEKETLAEKSRASRERFPGGIKAGGASRAGSHRAARRN